MRHLQTDPSPGRYKHAIYESFELFHEIDKQTDYFFSIVHSNVGGVWTSLNVRNYVLCYSVLH